MTLMARLSDESDLVLMSEFQGATRVDYPTYVTLVRVKLVGDSTGRIEILYYKFANATINNAREAIEGLVNSVMDDINFVTWRDPVVANPKPSRLSLSNRDYRYFVFLLESGNYSFASKQHPFRVEAKKANYFYEAKCAWKEGTNYKHERLAKTGYPSKHGYFIAFSDEDIVDHGEGFVSNFNIYLDLDFGSGDFVPISIDPDVGYPGGNS